MSGKLQAAGVAAGVIVRIPGAERYIGGVHGLLLLNPPVELGRARQSWTTGTPEQIRDDIAAIAAAYCSRCGANPCACDEDLR